MSSITKPVTATAAMILHDEGKLDINAAASNYIPELKGGGKEEILIHQLMTHSSGMNDEAMWKYFDQNKNNITAPELPENQHPAGFTGKKGYSTVNRYLK